MSHPPSPANEAARPADGRLQLVLERLQAVAGARAARIQTQLAHRMPWGEDEPEPAQIRGVYNQARQALEDERHDEAVLDFTALCAVRPYEWRFFFGLGLALHMKGLTEDALDAYGVANALNASDAGCLLRMGECLLALGQPDEARQAWIDARKLCNVPGTPEHLRGLIDGLLDQLAA